MKKHLKDLILHQKANEKAALSSFCYMLSLGLLTHPPRHMSKSTDKTKHNFVEFQKVFRPEKCISAHMTGPWNTSHIWASDQRNAEEKKKSLPTNILKSLKFWPLKTTFGLSHCLSVFHPRIPDGRRKWEQIPGYLKTKLKVVSQK